MSGPLSAAASASGKRARARATADAGGREMARFLVAFVVLLFFGFVFAIVATNSVYALPVLW